MALGFTLVASGEDTTNTSSYPIAATLTAGTRYYLGIGLYDAGGAAAAPTTVRSPDLEDWTEMSSTASGASGITVWTVRASAGSSGNITASFPVSLEGIHYALLFATDAELAHQRGDPVTTSGTSGTSASITMPALGSANNAVLGFIQRNGATDTTEGSGYTEIADEFSVLNPPSTGPRGLQVQSKVNTTTCDWSWTGSTSYRGVAFEIVQATAGAQTVAAPLLSLAPTIHSPVVSQPGTTTSWQFGTFPVCGGGACNAGSVSPYNSLRAVAVGDLAGPWYTSDGGLNWERCASGIGDYSPTNTGGAIEWSKDAGEPDRVWMLTSGGMFVSNTWPPTWDLVSASVQGGEHGNRPRKVGGMLSDTGTGIVYVTELTVAHRYDVAGANGDNGTFTQIASGMSGANAITHDPASIGNVYIATAAGIEYVPNANTRSTNGNSTVAGLAGNTWDLEAVDESPTAVYVAAGTNGVRRYNTNTGAWQDKTGNVTGGQCCSIVTRRSGGLTFVAVGIDGSQQSGGNFQQWFTTSNAEAAPPTWTCVTLDNGNMDVLETEGVGGEDWIGYNLPTEGGSYGNKLRDESTYTPHDSSLSADGRYLWAFSTGGAYKFDITNKQVFPAMHKLGTTTKGAIRTHPTDPNFVAAANTDHGAFFSKDGGARWFKLERGAVPQGTTQGTSIAFDPGNTNRLFLGHGNRNANSGGGVYYLDDVDGFGSWVNLNAPSNLQPASMDARRIGTNLHLFVAFCNGGIKRYTAPLTDIAGGTWTNATGGAFASGGQSFNGSNMQWYDDDLLYTYSRASGVWRCTNPTAATPNFVNIYAVNDDSADQRDGFMRIDETTLGRIFVASKSLGVKKLTRADTGTNPTVTTMLKPGGAAFARAGLLDVKQGIVYAVEVKQSGTASVANPGVAAIYSTAVSTTEFTDTITDSWFAANTVKQSDMAVNADSTRLFIAGRGGGVWGGTRGLASAAEQFVGAPLLSLAPTIYEPSVEPGSGAGQTVVAPLLSLAPTVYSPLVTQGGTPTQVIGAPLLSLAPTVHAPLVVGGADPATPPASVESTRVRKTRRFPKP